MKSMLDNQMNSMFAEGGVMQEGGTVDPVSGNDVPPGAMKEEVRDDIDAKLSEGEFVIPADVVRYIGLEKLMMMRDKAKAGLQKMEEIGQMGNADEVPDGEALHGGEDEMDDETFSSEIDSILSEDDGEDRGYAAGGYVVPDNAKLYRDAPIKGFEMVPMTNDEGQTMYIPYINGVAQLTVPAGYRVRKTDEVVKTDTAIKTDAATTTNTDNSGGGGDGSGSGGSGGNTDGSAAGGGQGISNSAIDAGLAAMAFGQSLAGKAISAVLGIPASTVANALGTAVVDNQINAIAASFGAMSDAATLGGQLGTVSDQSGNISTVSNQGITDAFDQATFGTTSSQMSADAASNATQAAETGMTTNAQGQTVSSNESIAAQDTANFGDTSGGGISASDANGGNGFGEGQYAKGGFVSKKKTSKPTSLASRRK
jgi:hypothetical protein